MQIYKEGDKSKAICEHCEKIVKTTFKVKDTTIKDGEEHFKLQNILVGVCDTCSTIISIPQQSFAAISEVRKKAEKETLEFRIPRHLLDVLNNSILSLGIESSSDLRSQLLRLYMASATVNSKIQKTKLKQNLKSDLLKGTFKRSNRLSIKVTPQLENHFEEIKKTYGLSQTELIDSLVVEVSNDILDGKNPNKSKQMKTALMATG